MRPWLLSLVLSSVALAQVPPPDPCDAHIDRFLALEGKFAAFDVLTLGEDVKALKQKMKQAASQQRELAREYAGIAAAQCGLVSVEASVMVGRLDEVMAGKLTSIQPPRGLTPEQAETFRRELAARARPLLERANETYRLATGKAAAAGFDSELLRLARTRLDPADAGTAH